MEPDDKRNLEAYSHLIGTDGWKLVELVLKEGIESEVNALVTASDAVKMAKAVGRIEAMKRILALPAAAISAYKAALNLPVFDDET